jgi:hypothetical protein
MPEWWEISKQPFARFAWLPVRVIDGPLIWLRTVWLNVNFAGQVYALPSDNG